MKLIKTVTLKTGLTIEQYQDKNGIITIKTK